MAGCVEQLYRKNTSLKKIKQSFRSFFYSLWNKQMLQSDKEAKFVFKPLNKPYFQVNHCFSNKKNETQTKQLNVSTKLNSLIFYSLP